MIHKKWQALFSLENIWNAYNLSSSCCSVDGSFMG